MDLSLPVPHPPEDSSTWLEDSAWLRRLARALVRDEATAEDLVQDALHVAGTREHPIQDLGAFLAGTVRRLASARKREEVRRARREAQVAREEPQPSDAELVESVDMMRVVLEELRSLPPAWQRVLTLRFLEDRSPDEIARREGCSPSTIRAHQTRGLAALRERLDRRSKGRASWLAALAPWTELESEAALTTVLPSTTVTTAAALGTLSMTTKSLGILLTLLAAGSRWVLRPDESVDLAPIQHAEGNTANATRASRPTGPVGEPIEEDGTARKLHSRGDSAVPGGTASHVIRLASSVDLPLHFVRYEDEAGEWVSLPSGKAITGINSGLSPRRIHAAGHVEREIPASATEVVLEPDALLVLRTEGCHDLRQWNLGKRFGGRQHVRGIEDGGLFVAGVFGSELRIAVEVRELAERLGFMAKMDVSVVYDNDWHAAIDWSPRSARRVIETLPDLGPRIRVAPLFARIRGSVDPEEEFRWTVLTIRDRTGFQSEERRPLLERPWGDIHLYRERHGAFEVRRKGRAEESFEDVPMGLVSVTAYRTDGSRIGRTIAEHTGDLIQLEMKGTHPFEARLVDASSGAPLEGVDVNLTLREVDEQGNNSALFWGGEFAARSDAQGTIHARGIQRPHPTSPWPPTDARLQLRVAGYEPWEGRLDWPSMESTALVTAAMVPRPADLVLKTPPSLTRAPSEAEQLLFERPGFEGLGDALDAHSIESYVERNDGLHLFLARDSRDFPGVLVAIESSEQLLLTDWEACAWGLQREGDTWAVHPQETYSLHIDASTLTGPERTLRAAYEWEGRYRNHWEAFRDLSQPLQAELTLPGQGMTLHLRLTEPGSEEAIETWSFEIRPGENRFRL